MPIYFPKFLRCVSASYASNLRAVAKNSNFTALQNNKLNTLWTRIL